MSTEDTELNILFDNYSIDEWLDSLLPLVDRGYFVNGTDIGRERAKAVIKAYVERERSTPPPEATVPQNSGDELQAKLTDLFFCAAGGITDMAKDEVAEAMVAIQAYVERERQKAYEQGVADEIKCVETSGEHLELQKQLTTPPKPRKD